MMSRLPYVLLTVAALGGCTELRGRKKIQEGTAAYRRGDFAGAVTRFEEATALVPGMPLLWLNLGYACRELIIPGGSPAVNGEAGRCALSAFKQLRALAPDDARGDHLYVQTLFDLGEYKTIERTFNLRHEKNPADLEVVLTLERVYVKTGRWREALTFYRKAAALRPGDALAQYAVGTFIWQLLAARGGGPAAESYDPRPRPERPPAPAPTTGDIVGADRVALAEEGIRYLQGALALHPRYPEAATYVGLLYRQESFALYDDLPAWERAISESIAYAARATEAP
jgi:tetratricopeptide (TPR) repeat protein